MEKIFLFVLVFKFVFSTQNNDNTKQNSNYEVKEYSILELIDNSSGSNSKFEYIQNSNESILQVDSNINGNTTTENSKDVIFKKCCENGKIFSKINLLCVIERNVVPTINVSELELYENNSLVNSQDYNVSFDIHMECDGNIQIREFFQLQTDGAIYRTDTRQMVRDSSCIELSYSDDNVLQLSEIRCIPKMSLLFYVWLCLAKTGFIVSFLILSCVLICYTLVPKLRDVSGLCMLYFVVSKWLLYLFLIITVYFNKEELGQFLCFLTGVILHFSVVSSFFWLCVLCFDIYWMIRSSVKGIRSKNMKMKKLIIYHIFGWGTPTGVVITAVVIDMLTSSEHIAGVLKPFYGGSICPMRFEAMLLYIHGVCLIPYTASLCLIIGSIAYIYKAKVSSRIFKKDNQSFNNNFVQQFWNRFILFVIMTLCWVGEFLSARFFVGHPAWMAADILNAFQGIFVFILFIRNGNRQQEIAASLRKSCCFIPNLLCLDKVFRTTDRSTEVQSTSIPSYTDASYTKASTNSSASSINNIAK